MTSSAKTFEPMPEEAAQAVLARREELEAVLRRGGSGDGREAVVRPPGHGDPLPTVSGAGGKTLLGCPVMTPEELSRITIPMQEVSASGQRLRELLEQHGVAVVTGVASAAECRTLEQCWQADLEAASAVPSPEVARDGPSAWNTVTTPLGSTWASEHSLPHGLFAWRSRLHPNVRQVFRELHETDGLTVGMDSLMFSTRRSATPPATVNDYWLHADQNRHHPGGDHKCFQSILYVWPSEGEEGSTTVLCPGTHKGWFDEMMTDPLTASKGHFVAHLALKQEGLREDLVRRGKEAARRVPVPSGGLLVWDSKASHQGWAAGPRLAVPICWEPRVFSSPSAKARKLWLCLTGKPSSHWASLGLLHPRCAAEFCSATTRSGPDALPLNPSIIPYPVRPSQVASWKEAVPTLWRWGGAKTCLEEFSTDEEAHAALQELVRQEVLDAL